MKSHRILFCFITIILAGGFLSASVAEAGQPEEVPAPAKPVVVENTDRIPVEEEVDATVVNTVEVEGTVEVQELRSSVEALNLPKKANDSYVKYHQIAAGANSGLTWEAPNEKFLASLITV